MCRTRDAPCSFPVFTIPRRRDCRCERIQGTDFRTGEKKTKKKERLIGGFNRSAVQNDVSTAQNDVSTAQNDVSSAQNDVSSVQNDVSTAQNDVSTGKNEVSTGKNDVSTGKNDVSTGKNDVSTGKNDVSTVRSLHPTSSSLARRSTHPPQERALVRRRQCIASPPDEGEMKTIPW